MPKTDFHGHPLIFDDYDDPGYQYLARKIDAKEVDVLFDYAKEHGAAQFETQLGKNYSLVHNNDGTYTIVKR